MKRKSFKKNKYKISIIGLGYVGLPLAIEFGKKFDVVGFDTNYQRLKELKLGFDRNSEIKKNDLKKIKKLIFTSDLKDLENCNIYIIAVPTPIYKDKTPNLSFLENATKLVAKVLKPGNIVIYESTVYPGTTDDFCAPILEKISGLKYITFKNQDNVKKGFYCGYSPERINPGDKKHTIKNVCKIISGSTPKVTNIINNLYKKIISAGTYKAENIRVAEAAKIIENTQRDINIALINELKIIFDKLDINTFSVLNAASTKWNFLRFVPGLVGGHCIGVDPYYLTYKAKSVGYKPKVVLSGRKINDEMGFYIAKRFIKKIKNVNNNKNIRILMMGITFKENCSDLRNSRIPDIIQVLKKNNFNVDVYDPIADPKSIHKEFNIKPISILKPKKYDGIIIAVAHNHFKKIGIKKIQNLCKNKKVIFDLKNMFGKIDSIN